MKVTLSLANIVSIRKVVIKLKKNIIKYNNVMMMMMVVVGGEKKSIVIGSSIY